MKNFPCCSKSDDYVIVNSIFGNIYTLVFVSCTQLRKIAICLHENIVTLSKILLLFCLFTWFSFLLLNLTLFTDTSL